MGNGVLLQGNVTEWKSLWDSIRLWSNKTIKKFSTEITAKLWSLGSFDETHSTGFYKMASHGRESFQAESTSSSSKSKLNKFMQRRSKLLNYSNKERTSISRLETFFHKEETQRVIFSCQLFEKGGKLSRLLLIYKKRNLKKFILFKKNWKWGKIFLSVKRIICVSRYRENELGSSKKAFKSLCWLVAFGCGNFFSNSAYYFLKKEDLQKFMIQV